MLGFDWDDEEGWVARLGIPTIPGFHSSRERLHGEGQPLLTVSDLEEHPCFEDPDGPQAPWVVAADNRVYEPKFGLIRCLAPAKVSKDSPKVYVDEIDWRSFPLEGELAYLFDVFFSCYDREVLMLVGVGRDGTGWVYHVPEQEASPGSVKWKADDEEMGAFLDVARWVGTIHIHPGSSCSPSVTDINDWAEPEKSGLHLIFGRDGSYMVSGAIAGRTFPLLDGNIEGVVRVPVGYTTSKGRTLEELLKESKPIVYHKPVRASRRAASTGQPSYPPTGFFFPYEAEFVKCGLERVGALSVETDQMEDLRVVTYGGSLYIMTLDQYEELESWFCGDTEIPHASVLRIRPAGRNT